MATHAARTRRAYRRTRSDFDPTGEGLFGMGCSELLRLKRTTPRMSDDDFESVIARLGDDGILTPVELRCLERAGYRLS
jgi:hypothetical protein